mmetsp:Transcript_80829/g.210889  ORF Transcript_80829/g.210889 Transcript_80829/m.210889 type:complete len:497 (-) Transcript_80829:149-1639(-)
MQVGRGRGAHGAAAQGAGGEGHGHVHGPVDARGRLAEGIAGVDTALLLAPRPLQGRQGRGSGAGQEVAQHGAPRVVVGVEEPVPPALHDHHGAIEPLSVHGRLAIASDGAAVAVFAFRHVRGHGAVRSEVGVALPYHIQHRDILGALVLADERVLCAAHKVIELAAPPREDDAAQLAVQGLVVVAPGHRAALAAAQQEDPRGGEECRQQALALGYEGVHLQRSDAVVAFHVLGVVSAVVEDVLHFGGIHERLRPSFRSLVVRVHGTAIVRGVDLRRVLQTDGTLVPHLSRLRLAVGEHHHPPEPRKRGGIGYWVPTNPRRAVQQHNQPARTIRHVRQFRVFRVWVAHAKVEHAIWSVWCPVREVGRRAEERFLFLVAGGWDGHQCVVASVLVLGHVLVDCRHRDVHIVVRHVHFERCLARAVGTICDAGAHDRRSGSPGSHRQRRLVHGGRGGHGRVNRSAGGSRRRRHVVQNGLGGHCRCISLGGAHLLARDGHG